jgi:hypothetical protein
LNPLGITDIVPRLLKLNGGLGDVAITPSKSGKILVIVTGDGAMSNNNINMYAQIYYNTSAAPAHGSDPLSASFTPVGTRTIVAYNSQPRSFSLSSVVTGLSIGTTYYFDLAIYSDSSTATASNINVSIVEL